MWWWREVRKATIPQEERDILERYGDQVIALMITSGHNPRSVALQEIYNNPAKLKNAEDWLTERSDRNERHEDRVETVEWAILVFVILGVIADFALLVSRV